jgi:hypothetical protein
VLLRNFGNTSMIASWGRWCVCTAMRLRTDENPARTAAGQFLDFQFREFGPIARTLSSGRAHGAAGHGGGRAAAADWMAAHTRDKHPPHEYRMEDYGLTPR